ncbi:MAG: ABC transporter substrate-binding protein [Arcanobacterium sp.]|nr:ABC transporter substrate-binding protein [Arcanobacterium sp.]
MQKFKRFAGLAAAAVIAVGGLSACSSDSSSSADDSKGKVYYLNFKPEQDEAWKKIAKAYTDETGTAVKIVTAASGTYEQTLKTEIDKAEAPTLFNINGPIGYQNWKDYVADLKGTEFAGLLGNPDLAVTEGEGVYGVPFVVEGYGIIYNDALLQKYIATSGAKIKSADEIKNFATLKAVAEDIQAKKDELGIKGAFASTSFAPGEDWRWQTHLANLPVFFELRDKGEKDTANLEFKYDQEYKALLDLYVNNSTVPAAQTSAKTVSDSMAEFAMGEAVFVQNGNWAWGQINEVPGNTVKAEDVHFLPMYTGVEGEEKQGISVGTENFMSLNAKASEADQKASLDFMVWLFSSDAGKKFVKEDLGFITPFSTFGENDIPSDPLGKEVAEFANNADLYNVDWNFVIFPSQDFKDGFGQELAQYVAGNRDWENVKKYVVDQWAAEKGN